MAQNNLALWKKKSLFQIGTFLVLMLFCNAKGISNNSIETTNKKLTHSLLPEEQQELKLFFHCLFAENELGYTLLGDKPVSFCFLFSNLVHIATRDVVFRIFMGEHPLYKGLKVWKNLKKETKNYSLIVYEEKDHPEMAILINKKAFFEVFNKNIDVFKKHYRSDITAESFLIDLQDKKTFYDKLMYQHLLIGIILGYGRHNAELFQRRWILSHSENKIPFSLNPKPGKGFSSVEEELLYLEQHLQILTKKYGHLSLVTSVNFAADPSWPDTILLKRKYALLHKELTAIFKRDDWLEILLSKLTEN